MAGSVILLAVFDGVAVSETFESTSCSFVLVEGISIGYRYASDEESISQLDRAYDLLFEATLKRFRARKGQFQTIDN
jgi:hypothetical protein